MSTIAENFASFPQESEPPKGWTGPMAVAPASATEHEAEDDLLRMLSHDLRAPLTSLQLQAQMIRRTLAATDPNLRRVDTILAACNRMTRLIGDLVDIARLESGRFELQPQSIDLLPFMQALKDRLAPTLEVGRVQVEVCEPLQVRADPQQLERIMVSLMSNALKYSGPGEAVRISLSRRENMACVAVIDRGVGIASQELGHIFERRSRAQARPTEGLGLGLYVTSLLVQAHQGIIEAQSQPGQGSVFRVLLPING